MSCEKINAVCPERISCPCGNMVHLCGSFRHRTSRPDGTTGKLIAGQDAGSASLPFPVRFHVDFEGFSRSGNTRVTFLRRYSP